MTVPTLPKRRMTPLRGHAVMRLPNHQMALPIHPLRHSTPSNSIASSLAGMCLIVAHDSQKATGWYRGKINLYGVSEA